MPTIQLTKTNETYCSNPDQKIIARPVESDIDVSATEVIDVVGEAVWRSTLSPTVTGFDTAVNCTAEIIGGQLSVTAGPTPGIGSLNFTVNDGDSGIDSNELTLNIMSLMGMALSSYSGSDEMGTLANPAVSPFGTHLLASIAGVPRAELFSELYGAKFEFGDVNAPDVAYGARVKQGEDLNGDISYSPLINAHVYTVPDGQGLTEFTASVTVKKDTGEEYTATKSIWVIDQETYFGGANTICVSNTLALNESAFVAEGAPAGATYVGVMPAFDEFHEKRVLFYGQDVFDEELWLGLGQNDLAIGSFGTGKAEITQGMLFNVNSTGSNVAASGGSFIKDSDVTNGYCRGIRVSDIRTKLINSGLSIDHVTFNDMDLDWSNLTTPDEDAGTLIIAPGHSSAYAPENGLNVDNMPFSAGMYIANSVFKGSSAISLVTEAIGSSGSIFDFVGGTSVTSFDFDSTTYSPGDIATLPGFGTVTFESNGDWVITAPNYDHETNYQMDVLTDDGVKTFYTGQCRALLNISGVDAEICGFAMINTLLENAREHNLRVMGEMLFVVRDVDAAGGREMREKHGFSLRTDSKSSGTLPNAPVNTGAWFGGTIPFGTEGIGVWGGTNRDTVNRWPVDNSFFSAISIATDMSETPSGGSAAAYHFTSSGGNLNVTNPERTGIKKGIVYNWYNSNDSLTKDMYLLNTTNDNQYEQYVIKAQQVGATPIITLPSTDVWNRDGILEPFYRDLEGDLPLPA